MATRFGEMKLLSDRRGDDQSMDRYSRSNSGIKFRVGPDDDDPDDRILPLVPPPCPRALTKKRRQSEVLLPFRGSTADRLNELCSAKIRESDEEKDEETEVPSVQAGFIFTSGTLWVVF